MLHRKKLTRLQPRHLQEFPVLRLVLEDSDGSIQRMTLHSTRPLISDFSDGQALVHIRALTQLTGTRVREVQQLTTMSLEMRSHPIASPPPQADSMYGLI